MRHGTPASRHPACWPVIHHRPRAGCERALREASVRGRPRLATLMDKEIVPVDPQPDRTARIRRLLRIAVFGSPASTRPGILRALSRHSRTHPLLVILGYSGAAGLGGFAIGALGYGGTLREGLLIGIAFAIFGAVQGLRTVATARHRS